MSIYEDFLNVDIRAGTIIDVQEFPKARKPAYKLKINFGDDIGILQSSAQITGLYKPADLINKQICAVINLPEKQIADFTSQCLVLGFYTEDDHVSLITAQHHVPNGNRLY